LNWAYKPGLNTNPHYYYKPAGLKQGDPVYLPGRSEPEPYLIWDSAQWYDSPYWAADRIRIYNAISAAWNSKMWGCDTCDCPYPCMDALKTGEVYYAGTNKEFTVIRTLRPVDTTQRFYYSSRQQEDYYSKMYNIITQEIRKTDYNTKLIAGWGFEAHKDDWFPWHTLIKPMIDKHIDMIDGIHEHHYGMDTRIITAGYEVISAYTLAKYNKPMQFLNTEVGGFLDPQRPDQIENNASGLSPGQKALNAISYHARDIIYMMDKSPDKAVARAVHEPQNTNNGVEMTFKLFKTLRGNLYQVETSDPHVFSVAGLNENTYTVACFNNHGIEKNISMQFKAPGAKTFTEVTILTPDTTESGLATILSQTLSISGNSWQHTATLSPYLPISYVFTLSGSIATPAMVTVEQFVADTILVKIPAGSQHVFFVDIPEAKLAQAQAARLKYVLMNYSNNGAFAVNGNNYAISGYAGGDPSKSLGGITYQPINLSDLQTTNQVILQAGDSAVEVWMLSIELLNSVLFDSLYTPIKNNFNNVDVQLYPNPVKDILHISLPAMYSENYSIVVSDIRGMVLLQKNNCQTIDFSALSAGIYLVEFQSKGLRIVQKVIKRGTFYFKKLKANF
jgi:hypothetical protein